MRPADTDETENSATESTDDGSMVLAAYAVIATAGAAVVAALAVAL